MDKFLLNIGFGGTVIADRVVAIVSLNSAPMKRLKDEAKEDQRLVDATHGRKTRSLIIMDSNHVVLSAIQAETISQRFLLFPRPPVQAKQHFARLSATGFPILDILFPIRPGSPVKAKRTVSITIL